MERLKAYIAGIGAFFREVMGELSKVMWPSWQRLLRLTGVVIGIVVIIMLYLFALDFPLGKAVERIVVR